MKTVSAFAVALLLSVAGLAADVPAQLPVPDGKPGSTTKPVKVYILAGQSNMVGMGDIQGAKNVYDGVYLSSDPAVPDQSFQIYQVGHYKASPLTIFKQDGTPTDDPVADGQFEVPQHGVYHLHCGQQNKTAPQMGVNQTPLCNLFTSMLQQTGVETSRFSSGSRTLNGLT